MSDERRAHVEAGAADDDRPAAPPRADESISDSREVGEAPGAELLADVDDPDQPMLEALALLGARRPRQHLEPAIDLERVAGDRDRVLAALAQALGDGDRDTGLPDPGGAEERQDLHAAPPLADRAEQRCCPVSVVEVALEISTSTSSPAAATPSKLTVLLWRVRPRSRVGSVRLGPSTRTSSVRPTKRCERSAARRCTTSTSCCMRSRLTGCGSWSG